MLKTKIGGLYKLEAVNAKTGKTRLLADWFPNLITNIGMDHLGPGTSATYNPDSFIACHVGSGSTPPTANDTAMKNHVATFNSSVSYNTLNKSVGVNSTSPYYRYHRGTWRFPEGAAAGNLSEVGMGWSATHSGNLFSRALILDSYGNPTTITVLSDEFLDVTYEFRAYPNESDVTGNVTLTGNIGGTYDWTIRPGHITQIPSIGGVSTLFPTRFGCIYGGTAVSDADIGIITASMPTSSSGASHSMSSYIAGNYYSDFTITVPLTGGNFATGIRRITLYIFGCGYQLRFDPAIPKTSSDVVTITLRVSWSRV